MIILFLLQTPEAIALHLQDGKGRTIKKGYSIRALPENTFGIASRQGKASGFTSSSIPVKFPTEVQIA